MTSGISCVRRDIVCVPHLPAGTSVSSPSHPRTSIHPHLISERELDILMAKAHLIIRSIQLKIGHDLLLQVTV